MSSAALGPPGVHVSSPPAAASAPAFVTVVTSTTPHQAVNTELTEFSLSALGADAIVDAPVTPSLGMYFGVQINGQALGWKLEVKQGVTVLWTLDVDDEVVWFFWNGTTWKITSWRAPEPDFTPRFTALGAWVSLGADANLIDDSGNGKDLTKSVTINPGPGYGLNRKSSAYSARYARTDAAFQIPGALSYEFLACNILNQSAGSVLQFGTGSGAAQNYQFWLGQVLDGAGVLRWTHRQQSGANVTTSLTGPAAPYGWAHVVVTRTALSATRMFVNATFSVAGALTVPDQGASGTLLMGGTVGAQTPMLFQASSIWPATLTDAQALYLGRLRLGKHGPLGI